MTSKNGIAPSNVHLNLVGNDEGGMMSYSEPVNGLSLGKKKQTSLGYLKILRKHILIMILTSNFQ